MTSVTGKKGSGMVNDDYGEPEQKATVHHYEGDTVIHGDLHFSVYDSGSHMRTRKDGFYGTVELRPGGQEPLLRFLGSAQGMAEVDFDLVRRKVLAAIVDISEGSRKAVQRDSEIAAEKVADRALAEMMARFTISARGGQATFAGDVLAEIESLLLARGGQIAKAVEDSVRAAVDADAPTATPAPARPSRWEVDARALLRQAYDGDGWLADTQEGRSFADNVGRLLEADGSQVASPWSMDARALLSEIAESDSDAAENAQALLDEKSDGGPYGVWNNRLVVETHDLLQALIEGRPDKSATRADIVDVVEGWRQRASAALHGFGQIAGVPEDVWVAWKTPVDQWAVRVGNDEDAVLVAENVAEEYVGLLVKIPQVLAALSRIASTADRTKDDEGWDYEAALSDVYDIVEDIRWALPGAGNEPQT